MSSGRVNPNGALRSPKHRSSSLVPDASRRFLGVIIHSFKSSLLSLRPRARLLDFCPPRAPIVFGREFAAGKRARPGGVRHRYRGNSKLPANASRGSLVWSLYLYVISVGMLIL